MFDDAFVGSSGRQDLNTIGTDRFCAARSAAPQPLPLPYADLPATFCLNFKCHFMFTRHIINIFVPYCFKTTLDKGAGCGNTSIVCH